MLKQPWEFESARGWKVSTLIKKLDKFSSIKDWKWKVLYFHLNADDSDNVDVDDNYLNGCPEISANSLPPTL